MDFVSPWMDKVRTACQRAEIDHVDMIVDQYAVDFSVLPALTTFSNPMMWQSLYQGLPEDIYPEDAPVLVRVNLSDAEHVQWLHNLAAGMMESAPLLICGSYRSFEQFADWFRDCVDTQHEGREGISRSWDTRIFPFLLSHILDVEQQKQLLIPVLFWTWLDCGCQSSIRLGGGEIPESDKSVAQIEFTDSQFEKLMCVSDTSQFLRYESVPEGVFTNRQAEFIACYEAILTATEQKTIFDDKCNDWVMAQVISNNSVT